MHHITQYTQYLHHNILIDWLVHNSLSGYMDSNYWLKFMAHFASICCYYPLNPQVIFYYGRDGNFGDRGLTILRSHHIRSFVLKAGESVHNQPNDSGPNFKLKNFYGNAIINWMVKHGTLKFTPSHRNSNLVKTCGYLQLSSATTTHEYFKKTHLLPLYLPDKDTNYQS